MDEIDECMHHSGFKSVQLTELLDVFYCLSSHDLEQIAQCTCQTVSSALLTTEHNAQKESFAQTYITETFAN